MPRIKHKLVLTLTSNLNAFLELDAGIGRRVPGNPEELMKVRDRQVQALRQRLQKQMRRLKRKTKSEAHLSRNLQKEKERSTPRHGRAVYPATCDVDAPNLQTIDFVKSTNCQTIAEIGVYQGHTSELLAKHLSGQGQLHLFDFTDRVTEVKDKLKASGYDNIVIHGNSHRTYDSYAWSLMRLLEKHERPIFDYVFLDGAHTWHIDALTFFLVDRLLRVGGYIDFDDYDWSLEKSTSMNPDVFPPTAKMYTQEQIRERHIKLIVDLLVKRDLRYKEVIRNKIYKKVRKSPASPQR